MDFSQLLLPGERLTMTLMLRRSATPTSDPLHPQTTSTITSTNSLNPTVQSTSQSGTTASNVGRGIYSLGKGVLKGMAGVVAEPYRGVAYGGGFGGLVIGIGKGAVGLVTSPLMGAMQGVGEVIGYPVIQPALAPSEFKHGVLALTSYRMLWLDRPPCEASQIGSDSMRDKRVRQLKEFPLATIIEVDIIAEVDNLNGRKLRIRSKDGVTAVFCPKRPESLVRMWALLMKALKQRLPTSFATVYRQKESNSAIYDAEAEYRRIGLVNAPSVPDQPPSFRVFKNEELGWICPSYPSVFVVPNEMTDEDVVAVARYRSHSRVPAVVWQHPITLATLSRSAQPRAGQNVTAGVINEVMSRATLGASSAIGMTASSVAGWEEDVNMVKAIRRASQSKSDKQDDTESNESDFSDGEYDDNQDRVYNTTTQENQQRSLVVTNIVVTGKQMDDQAQQSEGSGCNNQPASTRDKPEPQHRQIDEDSELFELMDALSPRVVVDKDQEVDKDSKEEKYTEGCTDWPTFHFIDARGQLAASGNQALGGGVEAPQQYGARCEITFCNMSNIHAVRRSYQQLSMLCQCDHKALPVMGQSPRASSSAGRNPGSSSGSTSSMNDSMWYSNLEATQWLQYISALLTTALHCSLVLKRGESILTHCSDGWDRTPQITATTMLLLDPYYRTMKGFQVLVEQEWRSFGHMFDSRCSHSATPRMLYRRAAGGGSNALNMNSSDEGEKMTGKSDARYTPEQRTSNEDSNDEAESGGSSSTDDAAGEANDLDLGISAAPHVNTTDLSEPPTWEHDSDFSPVFVQWLDAVHQIHNQFPWAFEFNLDLLEYLASHVNSCRYGTFLCNCEKERSELNLNGTTITIWDDVHAPDTVHLFLNSCYESGHTQRCSMVMNSPLPIRCSLRWMELWRAHLRRWDAVGEVVSGSLAVSSPLAIPCRYVHYDAQSQSGSTRQEGA